MCLVCVQFNNDILTVKEARIALKELINTSDGLSEEELVHYAELDVNLKILESLDAE